MIFALFFCYVLMFVLNLTWFCFAHSSSAWNAVATQFSMIAINLSLFFKIYTFGIVTRGQGLVLRHQFLSFCGPGFWAILLSSLGSIQSILPQKQSGYFSFFKISFTEFIFQKFSLSFEIDTCFSFLSIYSIISILKTHMYSKISFT